MQDSRKFTEQQWLTSAAKLRHDAQQTALLISRGRIPAEFGVVVADLNATAHQIEQEPDSVDIPGLKVLPEWARDRLSRIYNRALYVAPPPALTPPLRALSMQADRAVLQQQYLNADRGVPVVVLDQVLSSPALSALREFCEEATIWYDVKKGGYLGAYLEDGFASPLLLQVAQELREALPAVFKDHRLRYAWGYKYDSAGEGIGVHADDAAVNVNLWLTGDTEQTATAAHGGLVIYKQAAEKGMSFEDMNSHSRDTKVKELSEQFSDPDKNTVRVPYKSNRAVIFDSTLFHKTDTFNFKAGYTSRRINLTMLFGVREGSTPERHEKENHRH